MFPISIAHSCCQLQKVFLPTHATLSSDFHPGQLLMFDPFSKFSRLNLSIKTTHLIIVKGWLKKNHFTVTNIAIEVITLPNLSNCLKLLIVEVMPQCRMINFVKVLHIHFTSN